MQTKVKLAAVEQWNEGAPRINGPDIYGASAKKPFLYAVPATGERPIRFSAEGLPAGLCMDAASGQITGSVAKDGEYQILLWAENRHGKAEKEFCIAIGKGLALTPPMGWNSWNAWDRSVDEDKMRSAADGLVKTGLAARGYSYVNIDSCWQGRRGGKYNAIQPNRKFTDMGALSNYIHAKGLKFGIYSTPWTVAWGRTDKKVLEEWGVDRLTGCSSGDPDPLYKPGSIPDGRYVGINKHEAEDVAQWVEWGVDYLKYDWCPNDPVSTERMGRVLKSANRDILFSITNQARIEHVDVFRKWAHLWRGINDTHDTYSSVVRNAFLSRDEFYQENWRPYVGPGAWRDLDMLPLGSLYDFSTETSCRPNRLTQDEQITNMTAWVLYPSPLMLSCDLSLVNDFELRLFGNEEVIAVNQDMLGKPAIRLYEHRSQQSGSDLPQINRRAWSRPLADGSFAVGLFNLADCPDEFPLDFSLLGISGTAAVRNLWERRDIGRIRDRLSINVPAHGAQLLRIQK